MIDSEQVPWGKGEKQAGEAVEIEPETIYLQGSEAQARISLRCDAEYWIKNPKYEFL